MHFSRLLFSAALLLLLLLPIHTCAFFRPPLFVFCDLLVLFGFVPLELLRLVVFGLLRRGGGGGGGVLGFVGVGWVGGLFVCSLTL